MFELYFLYRKQKTNCDKNSYDYLRIILGQFYRMSLFKLYFVRDISTDTRGKFLAIKFNIYI